MRSLGVPLRLPTLPRLPYAGWGGGSPPMPALWEPFLNFASPRSATQGTSSKCQCVPAAARKRIYVTRSESLTSSVEDVGATKRTQGKPWGNARWPQTGGISGGDRSLYHPEDIADGGGACRHKVHDRVPGVWGTAAYRWDGEEWPRAAGFPIDPSGRQRVPGFPLIRLPGPC